MVGLKRVGTVVAALFLLPAGAVQASAETDSTEMVAAVESAQVDFQLLESKALLNGRGTLRLWQKYSDGCVHADVMNAPQGTVSVEREDGYIKTYAVNGVDGGSASTSSVHTRDGAVRGAYFSNGVSTYTNRYYKTHSVC